MFNLIFVAKTLLVQKRQSQSDEILYVMSVMKWKNVTHRQMKWLQDLFLSRWYLKQAQQQERNIIIRQLYFVPTSKVPTKKNNSVKLTGVENTEAWFGKVGVTSEVQAHFTAVGGQLREWFGAASKEQDAVVILVNHLKSEISLEIVLLEHVKL